MAFFKRKKTIDPKKGADKKKEEEKVDQSAAEIKSGKKEEIKVKKTQKVGKIATDEKIKDEKKPSMKELYGGGQAQKSVSKDDKKSEKTAKGKPERIFRDAYKVIVRPLITEKAANLGSENKYVFAVNIKANKIEIAKAVNEVYGIKPVRVNIICVKGKKVRHGRTIGQRKNWKKAVITLPEGKTIKVYEGV